MSGTIPLSLTQQFDEFGKPLKGGQLYLIQSGTVSTPQDGFQEPALVTKLPYPITLDAAGRIPQFFLADGFIKVRLQDARGVVQLASDGIQVIGPSSGGGGGTPVDPNALIQMGNMIARYGVGVFPGYVRLNGLTIGSAISGATERADADTQALFMYLWSADLTLFVSGGRGASAASDWAANKQLSLPDWRGCAISALDDMGNVPAGILTPGFFPQGPTTLGAFGGSQFGTITNAMLPPYTPSGLITNGHITNVVTSGTYAGDGQLAGVGTGATIAIVAAGGIIVTSTQAPSTFAGTPQGGINEAFRSFGPRRLCTIYIKL